MGCLIPYSDMGLNKFYHVVSIITLQLPWKSGIDLAVCLVDEDAPYGILHTMMLHIVNL